MRTDENLLTESTTPPLRRLITWKQMQCVNFESSQNLESRFQLVGSSQACSKSNCQR